MGSSIRCLITSDNRIFDSDFYLTDDWLPDIFHAHDLHAALVPYFLQQIRKTDSRFRKSRSILTITMQVIRADTLDN